MSQRKVLSNGKLRVELDKSQVFEDDPGQGTPAMVISGNFASTYWAATGEGELLSDRDGAKQLTESEVEWLDSLSEEIESFLYGK